VAIAGARFTMGSAQPRNALGLPLSLADVPRFALERTEVRVDDYQRFAIAQGKAPVRGAPSAPAVHVSFDDAAAYCAWRTPEGRLPTEQEWELAARGDQGRRFPWGDAPNPTCVHGDGKSGPVDVDALECGASPAGALHLVGNVWEWTSSQPMRPGTKQPLPGFHVTRGGSYATPAPELDAHARAFTREGDDTTGFRCAVSLPPST
jgi:formylglycine-generating enzyme required for sulfatase activity